MATSGDTDRCRGACLDQFDDGEFLGGNVTRGFYVKVVVLRYKMFINNFSGDGIVRWAGLIPKRIFRANLNANIRRNLDQI